MEMVSAGSHKASIRIKRARYRKKAFPDWEFVHILLDVPPGYRYYMCLHPGCEKYRSTMKLLMDHSQTEHGRSIEACLHVGRHREDEFVDLNPLKHLPRKMPLAEIPREYFTFPKLRELALSPVSADDITRDTPIAEPSKALEEARTNYPTPETSKALVPRGTASTPAGIHSTIAELAPVRRRKLDLSLSECGARRRRSGIPQQPKAAQLRLRLGNEQLAQERKPKDTKKNAMNAAKTLQELQENIVPSIEDMALLTRNRRKSVRTSKKPLKYKSQDERLLLEAAK